MYYLKLYGRNFFFLYIYLTQLKSTTQYSPSLTLPSAVSQFYFPAYCSAVWNKNFPSFLLILFFFSSQCSDFHIVPHLTQFYNHVNEAWKRQSFTFVIERKELNRREFITCLQNSKEQKNIHTFHFHVVLHSYQQKITKC